MRNPSFHHPSKAGSSLLFCFPRLSTTAASSAPSLETQHFRLGIAQASERQRQAAEGVAAGKEICRGLEREKAELQQERGAATAALLDAQQLLEQLAAHAPGACTLRGWSELLGASGGAGPSS